MNATDDATLSSNEFMMYDYFTLDTWTWFVILFILIGSSVSYVITNMMIRPIWVSPIFSRSRIYKI